MSWWSNYKLLYQRQSSIRIPEDDTRSTYIPKVLRALIFKAHRISRFSEFISYKEPYKICEKEAHDCKRKTIPSKVFGILWKMFTGSTFSPFAYFFIYFLVVNIVFQPMLKRLSFQMEQKNRIYLWIFFSGSINNIF